MKDIPFLWVIHCPRTGGTSLKVHCDKLQKRSLIGYHNTSHSKYTDAERSGLENRFSRVVPITVIRDPVQQMLSLYSYYLADKNNPDHKLAKQIPLTQWLDKYEHVNYYVAYYGLGDINHAEEILKKFDHLFRLENLKDEFNAVLSGLGLEANFDEHQHKNDIHRYKATPEEMKKIKLVREKDYALLAKLGFEYE